MKVTITLGETFLVEFSTGKAVELTHQEWLELRKMQNALIYTEPT